jgi:hypothetical protein
MCRNDGNAPEFELNFFDTYDGCCEFSWIPTEECLANKPVPDTDKWYPVSGDGFCANDGRPSNGVVLSNTSEECCKRFFSASMSNCLYKSDKRWYPNYDVGYCVNDGTHPQGVLMSETAEKCCDRFMSPNKAKCYTDSKVSLLTPKPTKKPTYKPTSSPTKKPNETTGLNESTCPSLKNYRQCRQDASCSWNGDKGFCEAVVVETTATSKPTEQPTNESICNALQKRPCNQNSFCGWNDATGICSSSLTETTPITGRPSNNPTSQPTKKTTNKPTPTKSPSKHPTLRPVATVDANSCASLTSKRKCNQNDLCSWNDATNKCSGTSDETHSPTHHPTSVDQGDVEMWYPIISQSRCVKLPSTKPDTDPYSTYQECCENPWMHSNVDCIEDAEVQLGIREPSSENPFYPDYFRGSCKNDGNQPESETDLYEDLDSCCNNPWLDAARCKHLAATESPSNNGLNPYYPDYFFNICRNDGKQLPAETYLFEEVEDCCGLEYMDDYESCVQLST